MKKILIGILVVLMIAGLVACGPPPFMQPQNGDNLNEAQENAAEQMVENILGEGVEVDIDDDSGSGSMNISTEEGDIQIQGNEDGMPWPSDKMPADVPVPKGVKFTSTMNMGLGIMVGFTGGDANMAKAYVEEMKAAGWEMYMEMEADGLIQVMAGNVNGDSLNFTFSEEENEGAVTYAAAE